MILLTTVLMVSLMAIMVLALLNSLNALTQVNQAMTATHEDLARLEGVARQMIRTFQRIPPHEQHGIWIEHELDYVYSLVDEGEFPCMVIAVGGQHYASHHWQLELHADKAPTPHLSLRVALPSQISQCETDWMVLPGPGLLTWRYAS